MAVATTSSVHKVTEKELPQYVDYVISKFDLRSFTTVVITLFLSESQECLEKSFTVPHFNEHSLIAVLDPKTSSHMRSLISPGFIEKLDFNYKVFYFPGTCKDLPIWSCPQGTFTAKLKVDHAGFISELWQYFRPRDRLQYFKYLIDNCFSIGLFLEVDSSQPVSWAILSNYGHIIHVYTVEQHRRKGYSRVTMLCLMQQILEANMTPMLEIEVNNTPSIKLNTALGFVESFDSAWTL